LCIAQLGKSAGGRGRRGGGEAAPPAVTGGMIAFDLATGDEKWRAPSASPAYGSPVVMTVDGMKVVVALSESQLVAVNTANGNEVWKLPLRQGNYNAATPIVDGQTLIFAGPGTGMTAVKLSKDGDALKEQELWRYTDNNLIFNTPVLKDGALYGLSTNDQLFCINSEHATGWTAPIAPAVAALFPAQPQSVFGLQDAGGQREGGGEMRGQGEGRGQRDGRGGPGRRGGGRGRGPAAGRGEPAR
jgi:outer membrane protein assembly factor BamB